MKSEKLTYEVICAAVKGEEKAQEFILDYYEAYIHSLVTRSEITASGTPIYTLDEAPANAKVWRISSQDGD